MKRTITLLGSSALLAVFLFSACAPQKTVKRRSATEADEVATSTVTAPSVEVQEANLRGGEYASAQELRTIHFDYDSSSLKEADLAVLKSNAAYLKAHLEIEVAVAGYCDERGTIQYNLALGQRRAKVTRDYYMRLGVSGRSVATISYGKERPVCAESTEDCWAQNRRAETLVRKTTVSQGTKNKSTPAQ